MSAAETIEEITVQANGLRMHALAAGPADGPLVVLLHGFPELARSWRRQLPALAAAGYRAVAPDQRGYGETELRGPYDAGTLARDVVELVRALGRERATLVGHDWGGAVAWTAAREHPEVVERLVALNCPPPEVLSRELRSSFRQLRRSWYMAFFQLPWLPERRMTRDGAAVVGAGARRWLAQPRGVEPRRRLSSYRAAFSRPGRAKAAIDWYRTAFRRSLVPRRRRAATAHLGADARALGHGRIAFSAPSSSSVPSCHECSHRGTSLRSCSSRRPGTSCRTKLPNGSTWSCCDGWGRPRSRGRGSARCCGRVDDRHTARGAAHRGRSRHVARRDRRRGRVRRDRWQQPAGRRLLARQRTPGGDCPTCPSSVDHAAAASWRGRFFVVGGYGADRRPLRAAYVFDGTALAPASAPAGCTCRSRRGRHGRAGSSTSSAAAPTKASRGRCSSSTCARCAGRRPRARRAASISRRPRSVGIVYVLGGRRAGYDTNVATVEAYDPRTRRWRRLPPIPGARGGTGAAGLAGRIVSVGGEEPAGTIGSVYAYDIARKRWTTLPSLPTPRHGLGVVAHGGRVWAIAGRARAGADGQRRRRVARRARLGGIGGASLVAELRRSFRGKDAGTDRI